MINDLREYLSKLEDIKVLLDDLPILDSRCDEFYENTYNEIIYEYKRIEKILYNAESKEVK